MRCGGVMPPGRRHEYQRRMAHLQYKLWAGKSATQREELENGLFRRSRAVWLKQSCICAELRHYDAEMLRSAVKTRTGLKKWAP